MAASTGCRSGKGGIPPGVCLAVAIVSELGRIPLCGGWVESKQVAQIETPVDRDPARTRGGDFGAVEGCMH